MVYFEDMILFSFIIFSAASASAYSLILRKGFISLGRELIVSSVTFNDDGNIVLLKNI